MTKRLYQKEYDEYTKETNKFITYYQFSKRLTDKKRYLKRKRELRKEQEKIQKQERVKRMQEKLKTFERTPKQNPVKWYSGIVKFFTDLF